MSQSGNGSNPLATDDELKFLLAQYTALRDEIQNRSKFQQQLVLGALIGAGAFLPVGIEREAPVVLLLYPILAMFLAAIWLQHSFQIRRIGRHIRTMERSAPGGVRYGWEIHEHRYGLQGTNRVRGLLLWYAVGGVFVGTQMATIIAAVPFVAQGGDWLELLFVVDWVIAFATFVALLPSTGILTTFLLGVLSRTRVVLATILSWR